MTMQLMSFNFHKKLFFTLLPISVVNLLLLCVVIDQDSILLRTSKDSTYAVDWAEFVSRDRHILQKAHEHVQSKLDKVTSNLNASSVNR